MSLAVFNVSMAIDPATSEDITPVYVPLPGTVRCITIPLIFLRSVSNYIYSQPSDTVQVYNQAAY